MTETLVTLTFFLFASILVLSALMVVSARNPVHAVLFLILAFFNAAGLFILLDAEFLAMMLVIVYVGAVAVLFLFVVMMLDIDFQTLRTGLRRQLPLGLALGGILLLEIVWTIATWSISPTATSHLAAPMSFTASAPQSNTHELGRLLYTQYAYLFQVSGLILLVAMIGAIVLTLRHSKKGYRQKPTDQVERPREAVLSVRKVQTGQGVDL